MKEGNDVVKTRARAPQSGARVFLFYQFYFILSMYNQVRVKFKSEMNIQLKKWRSVKKTKNCQRQLKITNIFSIFRKISVVFLLMFEIRLRNFI